MIEKVLNFRIMKWLLVKLACDIAEKEGGYWGDGGVDFITSRCSYIYT